jgi:hypothetical protein
MRTVAQAMPTNQQEASDGNLRARTGREQHLALVQELL